MIPRILGNRQCVATDCDVGCCNDSDQCATALSECRKLEVGETCYENYECRDSCCIDKTCQGESECKLKELGMLSFFAVFILSSIIILIIGLYFHAKQKRQQEQMRRVRGPRISQIIAEGEIHEGQKPPIHTIAIHETQENTPELKSDRQKPYLKKPDPVRTIADDGFEKVLWRTRANSRTWKMNEPIQNITLNTSSNPLELSSFDPFIRSRSSSQHRIIEEGREVFPEYVIQEEELRQNGVEVLDVDQDYTQQQA